MSYVRETTISLKDIAPSVTNTCVNKPSAEIADQFSEICNNIVNMSLKKNKNGFPDIMHDVTDNVARLH